jgi:hypothetical protein
MSGVGNWSIVGVAVKGLLEGLHKVGLQLWLVVIMLLAKMVMRLLAEGLVEGLV